MSTKFPKELQKLIDRFKRNEKVYKNGKYNETQVRREFLDPLFEILGWDVDNKSGAAEQYKEVIHEDSIKVQKSNKSPDYCFRVGSQRKFFVEAKKPSVKIKTDSSPAYQIRRYGWSAKLPLSILTDFDEFAVYDCRIKPKSNDSAAVARILYFKYEDFEKNWDQLYSVFSKEAVWQGSFDKYAENDDKKRGTSEVDKDFLKQLEKWREILAKNLVKKNKGITTSDLNFAVQRTLDRILFLRISEDRGLEESKRLNDALKEKNIYQTLCSMFREADDKYNSGLFHFRKTNDRPTPPDELSLSLTIEDKVLKEIINGLYYPESAYEFSVMPLEILGQVYEQFLGKEISITSSGKVSITEKPLVKKAGGVFYTPEYVVNKIIDDTLAKLMKGKTPTTVSKLKILDASCGSGSFLIEVYDYLLRWHLDWYLNNLQKSKNKVYRNINNDWCLTPQERKRILTNNIYGVDIDAQAVETTKLSLCLKVLEGETRESLAMQLSLFKEHALPDIGDNIKCGNSLVGFDADLDSLTNDELYKINPFDWKNEFEEVFRKKDGGFDVIVGNPPYLRVQGLNEFHGNEIAYYSAKYKSAVKRFDLYLLFIERCYELLNKKGLLGFICPHKFLISDFGSGIRNFLVETKSIDRLLSFNHNMIFDKASTYTCLLYLSKKRSDSFQYLETPELKSSEIKKLLREDDSDNYSKILLKDLDSTSWKLGGDKEKTILEKINDSNYDSVKTIFKEVMVGIQTGIDDIHILKSIGSKSKKNTMTLYSTEFNGEIEIEKKLIKPFLMGDDIKRYEGLEPKHYVIYPYKLIDGKTKILEESELKSLFPLGYKYLKKYKTKLELKRETSKTNSTYWYSCHRSKDINIFESNRIIMPYANLGCNFTIAGKGDYHNTKAYSLVKDNNVGEDYKYFLAILNSNLMWWYQTIVGNVIRGGYYTFTKNYIDDFKIPRIDFENKKSVKIHNKLVSLVETIMEYKLTISQMNTDHEKTFLMRQITSKENEIEKIVEKLFGITAEELVEVENKAIKKQSSI